jgi:hypothetical protein
MKRNKSRKNRILSGFLRFFLQQKSRKFAKIGFVTCKIRHIGCVNKNAELPE